MTSNYNKMEYCLSKGFELLFAETDLAVTDYSFFPNVVVAFVNDTRIIEVKGMSSLWKRMIAWGQSCAASAYGIIWEDAGHIKRGGI